MKTHLTNEITGTYTKRDYWRQYLIIIAVALGIGTVLVELLLGDVITGLMMGV